MSYLNDIYLKAGIDQELIQATKQIEGELKERFEKIDSISEYNQIKVINAMRKCGVNTECMGSSTGYGYDDYGREVLEKVYATVFNTEDALVRPSITCGTHALTLALRAVLRPGDELLCPAGRPYDTLEGVIGKNDKNTPASLKEFNISYKEIPLLDGGFNYDEIKKAINDKTKLVEIQRSKGYDMRPSFSVEEINELVRFIKDIKPEVIIMIDNCYGEFTELEEPSGLMCDMICGSLIKNPGGGLAPIGGYIAGSKKCVELCANTLTAPGLGKEVGATLGVNRSLFQGFFMAPVVTAGALKGAILSAALYEKYGYECVPTAAEERHDIIQSVRLGSREKMVAFCEGIQAGSAVDSNVYPEPYPMPGYHSDVIMAAGAFIQGSSIELSADGPIEEPYAVYFQGGLTYYNAKLGILTSLQKLKNKGLL
ncbi:MAG: methionine gamma-lyase family protein [Lachnospiraceae bacterium]|nr:methionine gamma-lyase family protein [Lachnospiraceae bacterium]